VYSPIARMGMGLHRTLCAWAAVSLTKRSVSLPSRAGTLSDMHPEFHRLKFEALQSVERVFLHLGCSPELARELFTNPDAFYSPRRIRRRRRGRAPRVVYEVSGDVRQIHRSISHGLQPHVSALPENVQGFRIDRSIVTNSGQHCGKPFVVVADIEGFFDNVLLDDVRKLFERLGCGRQPALLLARLCTYKGRLVQGGRASPAIANLVATKVDELFGSRFPQLAYTRYADDLAFSGSDLPSAAQISEILQQCGFALRAGSYRLQSSNGGQYVTGLNVQGLQPRVPRSVRRTIQRTLRFASTYSVTGHLAQTLGRPPTIVEIDRFLQTLHGRIVSYGRVEPSLGQLWIGQFNQLRRTIAQGDRPA
jgi:RNA-directed DNA polymerase